MKKTPMLLALILILAMVLSACGCKHTWTEASCQAPKTCTLCGLTEGTALGHSWKDASCEAAKTCTLCYEIDGVKQVLDLDFYMGETEEEARERLDTRYRDFTAYYDRVNGITLLYYIG